MGEKDCLHLLGLYKPYVARLIDVAQTIWSHFALSFCQKDRKFPFFALNLLWLFQHKLTSKVQKLCVNEHFRSTFLILQFRSTKMAFIPKLFLIFAICFVIFYNVNAVGAPEYLQVANHQACLEKKDFGTWEGYCTPANKPADCPEESWTKLNSLTGNDKPSPC